MLSLDSVLGCIVFTVGLLLHVLAIPIATLVVLLVDSPICFLRLLLRLGASRLSSPFLAAGWRGWRTWCGWRASCAIAGLQDNLSIFELVLSTPVNNSLEFALPVAVLVHSSMHDSNHAVWVVCERRRLTHASEQARL